MFKNQFQGSSGIELLTQQGSQPLINWKVHRNGSYLLSPSITAAHKKSHEPLSKVYERECKGFIYVLEGSTRLQFPVDERKGAHLIQPFLCIQLFLPKDHLLHLDLGVMAGDNRRRLLLSSSVREFKTTPLHASVPLQFTTNDLEHLNLPSDTWVNLIIDLESLVRVAFKNQCSFKSLETISICAPFCRIRKIFTLRDRPVLFPNARKDGDRDSISRTYQFPTGTDYRTHFFDLSCVHDKAAELKILNSTMCVGDDGVDSKSSVGEKPKPVVRKPKTVNKMQAEKKGEDVNENNEITGKKPRVPVVAGKQRAMKPNSSTPDISANTKNQKEKLFKPVNAKEMTNQPVKKKTLVPLKNTKKGASKIPSITTELSTPSSADSDVHVEFKKMVDRYENEEEDEHSPLPPPQPHEYPTEECRDSEVNRELGYNPSKYQLTISTPELPSSTETVDTHFEWNTHSSDVKYDEKEKDGDDEDYSIPAAYNSVADAYRPNALTSSSNHDPTPPEMKPSKEPETLLNRENSLSQIVNESVFDVNESDEENEELMKIVQGSESLMSSATKLLNDLRIHSSSSSSYSSVVDLPSVVENFSE